MIEKRHIPTELLLPASASHKRLIHERSAFNCLDDFVEFLEAVPEPAPYREPTESTSFQEPMQSALFREPTESAPAREPPESAPEPAPVPEPTEPASVWEPTERGGGGGGYLIHGPAGVPGLATKCLCVLSTWLVVCC